MRKVMLVIENEIERKFLERLIKRLGYQVVALSRSTKLAQELRESFPDIVFASMIGKSTKTLEALAQIKVEKGIPKVVFVRSSKDTVPLNPQQKRLLDGVLYSPIDPFKLLEILANISGVSLDELKGKYRDMLGRDRGSSSSIIVKGSNQEQGSGVGDVLIIDSKRKKHYEDVVVALKEKNQNHPEFDGNRFRELQKMQAQENLEEPQQKKLKKDFINKLFSAKPKARGNF